VRLRTSKYDEIVEKLQDAKLPDVDFDKYYKTHADDKQKLKRVVDYYDELEKHLEHGDVIHGAKLPFPKLNKLFRFRDGEVTLWTGFNGHKKSMMLGYAALGFLKESQKVCIASFEMKPIRTIERMARQHGHAEKVDYDVIGDFMSFAASNLYIFDHQGEINPNRLMAIIFYCAKELGVKHFIIDSLMRVVAGEDSYNEQKDFVVKLCNMAIETDIHIHLVHHTKKGREDSPSSRYDAKGSGAISDNVHNSLIVWSNKEDKSDMPDVILKCDKQREGEWEGSIPIKFDATTMRFYEVVGDEY
jgi:twinkle protein